MNNISTLIDIEKKPLSQWNDFDETTKLKIKTFFNLRNTEKYTKSKNSPFNHNYNYHLTDEDIARTVFCIVLSTIQYNKTHNMQRAIFGNSGGLDSATICALYDRIVKLSTALDINFQTYSFNLPIVSNPEHAKRAASTAKNYKNIQHITIEHLDDIFNTFKKSLTPITKILEFNEEETRRGYGNVKARIRMITNFFASTKSGSYVISTDNLSELYMAFWTLMGDVGAYGPIQNILKGLELPTIAYALGIPEETLSAKPTDGLSVHESLDEHEGGDADAFKGVQYPHLDAIICHATKNGFDLKSTKTVQVDPNLIDSEYATDHVVESLIQQMASPSSVWKRTAGSIGIAISRDELGLTPLTKIAELL